VRRLEDDWAPRAALVCLSVRSGFHLLLEALELAPGTEVLLSAVTHPDMVRIARAHALEPVALDLDLETLAVRPHAVDAAVGDRTKLVVIAHLFGTRNDLRPLAEVASRHGLLLVEDCAQVFRGPHDAGDPHANVSLFSFGPIKECTALGGALVRVDDPALLERMRRIQSTWPHQRRRAYASKALKFLALQVLARPRVFGLFVRAYGLRGRDFDELLTAFVRSRRSDAELASFVRGRPSAPLLAVLARRLRRFDHARLARRIEIGTSLADDLAPTLDRPGRRAAENTFWVFPVMTDDRARLAATLLEHGFDAAAGTTSIAAAGGAEHADRLMERVLFIPAYPELPRRAVRRLGEVLRRHEPTSGRLVSH
jgi:dTDP-4-amino-4,6-dideoxygalactose transaminase